jgi:hypothetical protein
MSRKTSCENALTAGLHRPHAHPAAWAALVTPPTACRKTDPQTRRPACPLNAASAGRGWTYRCQTMNCAASSASCYLLCHPSKQLCVSPQTHRAFFFVKGCCPWNGFMLRVFGSPCLRRSTHLLCMLSVSQLSAADTMERASRSASPITNGMLRDAPSGGVGAPVERRRFESAELPFKLLAAALLLMACEKLCGFRTRRHTHSGENQHRQCLDATTVFQPNRWVLERFAAFSDERLGSDVVTPKPNGLCFGLEEDHRRVNCFHRRWTWLLRECLWRTRRVA